MSESEVCGTTAWKLPSAFEDGEWETQYTAAIRKVSTCSNPLITFKP